MQLKEHILIVDDNADNRSILEELLGDLYTVQSAASGEEALRMASRFQPQLVLLDVMMPGLNGIQTCRRLLEKSTTSGIKIVMLSARSDLADRLKAYDVGAVDYISKPFHEQEVLAKVRSWIQMVYKQQVDDIWHDAEKMRETIGSTMVTLAEFQHTESGNHLFRLRWYAQALAEQLAVAGPYTSQIDEAFLQHLYRASPLHDIGKVAIDDVIFEQEVPLTEFDIEIRKRHTVFGSDMLARAANQLPGADYLKMAVSIARHHHERFDGSGYPDGLVGADIPLAARIVAVADAFDALTSQRRLSVIEAVNTIEENAARSFDPVVVDSLRLRLDDFSQAYLRFTDQNLVSSRAAVFDSIGNDHRRPEVAVPAEQSQTRSATVSL